MTLGQWWQILTLYEVLLVWLLALGAFFWILRAKTRRARVIGAAVLVLLFTPFFHRWAGDFYFDYLCEHEAGEFIYRTVDNVEGILQMRPRDGSKDYFDRMAKGDIPEDPWGHTNRDAQFPWHMLETFNVVETLAAVMPPSHRRSLYNGSLFALPTDPQQFARYYGYDGRSLQSIRKLLVTEPASRYGYLWNEITTHTQKVMNIRGGELLVLDRVTNDLLGRKVGFIRLRRESVCPEGKSEEHAERFVSRVVRPVPYRN